MRTAVDRTAAAGVGRTGFVDLDLDHIGPVDLDLDLEVGRTVPAAADRTAIVPVADRTALVLGLAGLAVGHTAEVEEIHLVLVDQAEHRIVRTEDYDPISASLEQRKV